MAKLLQLRGGTTSQHSSFTGAVREVTVDTDKDILVVHDGSTAGGFPAHRDLKGSDISSADPLVIVAGSNYFIVTGTTGFNDMTVAANTHFFLEFAAALVMTHVGGALDLPSAAPITTAAGDVGEFFATAANVVTCVNYTKASGAVTLADDQVTYAKIQNVSADERILGRVSGADGVIEELTKAQVLTFANVEDGADVTDATNVTAAGALMDSECSGLAAVKATTGTFLTADQTKLDAIEASATADQTAGEILTLLVDGVDSTHYKDGSIDEVHLANNSVSLEKMAGGIDGKIITFDASGDPVAVGPGSDGEVLTSTGAGSPPAFEAAAGGGKLLQILSATKTDTATNGSGTYSTITGLSIAITPSASSKVLVFWNLNVNGNNDGSCMGIIRDSSLIAEGDASGVTVPCTANTYTTLSGEIKNVAGQHLDDPSADGSTAFTYAVQWKSEGSQTDYLNRAEGEATTNRCVSSITLVEYGA